MRFCYYFGHYYCTSCHTGQTSVLPSQIIRHWNFSRYSVCDHAITLLQGKSKKPLIDLSIHNPEIYENPQLPFQRIRKMREKLMFQSDYINSCKRQEELQKILGDKKHFFESVHIYSLADLFEIHGGTLIPAIEAISARVTSHIMTCDHCTAKAFICEICYSKELLFPFEFEKIGRCLTCGRIFHKKCYETLKAAQSSCPVCVRTIKIRGKD
jgi:hypothetical protein